MLFILCPPNTSHPSALYSSGSWSMISLVPDGDGGDGEEEDDDVIKLTVYWDICIKIFLKSHAR